MMAWMEEANIAERTSRHTRYGLRTYGALRTGLGHRDL